MPALLVTLLAALVVAVSVARWGPGNHLEFEHRVFRRRHELLLAWLPDVKGFILPDANHLLHVQNPRGMAERLASFFEQHATSTGVAGVSGGAGSSGARAGT